MNNQAILIALLFVLSACIASAQQDLSDSQEAFSNSDRVRLTIDLTDEDIRELRAHGRLRMKVHDYFKHRVAAVLLRYVDPYLDEKVRVAGEPRVVEGVSQIRFSELMVERLLFQPIEFRVYEKNFAEVEIVYVNDPDVRVFVANEEKGLTREEYQVQIGDRMSFRARISQLEDINLTTGFGILQLNWNDVEQVVFGDLGSASAKVFLKDGNAITGQLDVSKLDIKTRWGKITIPTDDLKLISR